MNLIILSLLIGLSIIIGRSKAFLLEDELEAMVDDQIQLNRNASEKRLLLSKNGSIWQDEMTIVWKGTYGGENVAVKMVRSYDGFKQESEIYGILDATTNPDIEKCGIPKVYCHGSFDSWIMQKVYFIAMTLFDDNLQSRFLKQKRTVGNISDLSLSLIFKRSVEVLHYIHSKNVTHNDIKPGNIFLRGPDVFIGDFNIATYGEDDNRCSTPRFASSNFLKLQRRTLIDDLQSLVFSIWDVAGVNYGGNTKYGGVIIDSINNNKLESEIEKNCQHFKDKKIQKAFGDICNIIFKNEDPDCITTINKILNPAIEKLSKNTKQTHFEWLSLSAPSSSRSI